jgi:hypothetical protein
MTVKRNIFWDATPFYPVVDCHFGRNILLKFSYQLESEPNKKQEVNWRRSDRGNTFLLRVGELLSEYMAYIPTDSNLQIE